MRIGGLIDVIDINWLNRRYFWERTVDDVKARAIGWNAAAAWAGRYLTRETTAGLNFRNEGCMEVGKCFKRQS